MDPTSVPRTSVSSSSIASVGYDPAAQVLVVEFVNGGVYAYSSVLRPVFDNFLRAPSKGRYFLQAVRGKFSYSRIE